MLILLHFESVVRTARQHNFLPLPDDINLFGDHWYDLEDCSNLDDIQDHSVVVEAHVEIVSDQMICWLGATEYLQTKRWPYAYDSQYVLIVFSEKTTCYMGFMTQT